MRISTSAHQVVNFAKLPHGERIVQHGVQLDKLRGSASGLLERHRPLPVPIEDYSSQITP